ncbi:hypothetical protein I5M27_11285 [Adhaeribacter sp. BT258]|uniref:Leucine-rich repeat domain-containing protein n=1 Tax=Adhaeribacter terrigena TaxID=2793070 RepID=A0ABS1C2E0_9BACT|nr:hypothetical protein [Adhaeribacter terrigena]MBK0403572.1 hypothetical protein [Adhaeribacter terrigena]
MKNENEIYYNSLNDEWKEIIKCNLIGLDTVENREKVFNKEYVPNEYELGKIESIDELWINWWENEPPSEDYGVSDLTPLLKFKNLRHLTIRSLNLSSIRPLASLHNIKTLFIDYSPISDLSPLSQLSELVELRLGNNLVTDIKPLFSLRKLKILHIKRMKINEADLKLFSTKNPTCEIVYEKLNSLELEFDYNDDLPF